MYLSPCLFWHSSTVNCFTAPTMTSHLSLATHFCLSVAFLDNWNWNSSCFVIWSNIDGGGGLPRWVDPTSACTCSCTYLPTYLHTCTYCKQIHKKALSFYSFPSIIAQQYETVCNWEYLQCIYLSFPCFCVLCMICLSFGCPALCFCVLFKCLCSFCETTHVTGSRPQYALRGSNIHSLSRIFHLHTVPCIYL